MEERLMQIGEIAKEVGCTARMIRYYEELGLIEPKARSKGGFRLYDEETLRRIQVIKRLNSLNFPLSRIKEMFSIRNRSQTGNDASRQVIKILEEQKCRAEKMIRQYEGISKDIESAMRLVRDCFGCTVRPTKENCECCRVVQSWQEVPLIFMAIM